jgi:hypothetical protein
MIKLIDVLGVKPRDFKQYKIHFASGVPDPREAYNALIMDAFEDYQNYQTRKNFNRPYIIALASCSKNKWAFAGVYKNCTSPEKISAKHWQYALRKLPIQTDLLKLMYVYYEKRFRQSYTNLELHPKLGEPLSEMKVIELRQTPSAIGDFKGFSNTIISFLDLQTIVDDNIPSWRDALSKVSCIYLITDMKTGKHYIGKADGSENLWQRWTTYAITGHGGNEELKTLLKDKGESYKYNFQFSILEICDFRSIVDERERYWKTALQSNFPFGYNKN